jgi:oligopeptide transport system substrate-binding protein
LLDLADQEIDEASRGAYLRQAEHILIEEMPVIPLYYMVYRFVKHERVRNGPMTHLGEYDLKWVSIAS